MRFSLSEQKTIDSIQRQLQRNPVSMGGGWDKKEGQKETRIPTQKHFHQYRLIANFGFFQRSFTFSTAKKNRIPTNTTYWGQLEQIRLS